MSPTPPPPIAPPKLFRVQIERSTVYDVIEVDDVVSYGPTPNERYYWVEDRHGIVLSWPTETIEAIRVYPQ